jgi:hypothetical protein
VKHPHGIEVDEYRFTIVDLRNVGHKMNIGFSIQLLHKCFTNFIRKTRRNKLLFLANSELLELTTWRMSKNTTNLTRGLSLWIQQG